jgi:RNA polymerase sigma factor (sigma-70 family)
VAPKLPITATVIGESITEGGPEEIVNPIPVQDQSSSEKKNRNGNREKIQERWKRMTKEEYGKAYQRGFNLTVRFLVSRGLSYDAALDTAQAAWAKGWERREQLRDPNLVLTWTNSIALNIHRTFLRREPQTQTLPELQAPPRMNVAAIDVKRILKECKPNDRVVLEGHYIEGYKVQEIARQHGWSETAVRIRLLRARRSVERRLSRPKHARLRNLAEKTKQALASALDVSPYEARVA